MTKQLVDNFEVAIIGGGIVGTALFSELCRKGVKCVLLEASEDVSNGSTKANSGIVHSGYDPTPGSLMAKFNLQGNLLYPAMCKRLGVKYLPCGTLTVSNEEGRERLNDLLKRGKQNGVKGLRIVENKELHAMEPNLQKDVTLGLFAPTGGLVSPYNVCVALAEEGIVNGGTVYCYFDVNKIKQERDKYTIYAKDNFAPLNCVHAKYVVNCAGANAVDINKLLGLPIPQNVSYVKGEYIILDKCLEGYVKRPIFPLPTAMGKGIVANLTVHGNILLGPTATPCEKDDTSVSTESIAQIVDKVCMTINRPNFGKTIKLFAGIRDKVGTDFVIERDKTHPRYYYTLGICSPGLTSAPAIAIYVCDMLIADGVKTKNITPKLRKPYPDLSTLSRKELNALIKSNPSYGKVICKCENVSEGEVIDILNSPLRPTSIDAIKRRVRPSMGRCQGSFCVPRLINLISNYCNIPKEKITLHGYGSEIVTGDLKQFGYYTKKQVNNIMKQITK
ncbi:MAG: NAD(P)/FAD-dependent oxidoreductase [Clostridia bacterium]|nr:NAD(P)/FAD-dependent oxidoreductase [Clostridia bacterium]